MRVEADVLGTALPMKGGVDAFAKGVERRRRSVRRSPSPLLKTARDWGLLAVRAAA
jgi:hypothetical protein